MTILSQERIRDEILKMMAGPAPSDSIRMMADVGVLKTVLPEVDAMRGMMQNTKFHHKDVFEHTMLVLDNMVAQTSDPILRFAALVHDVGKPPTYKIVEGKGVTFHGHEPLGAKMVRKMMNRMHFSGEERDLVSFLVDAHLRIPMLAGTHDVSDSAIRRVAVAAGDRLDALEKLVRSDMTGKNPRNIARNVANLDAFMERMRKLMEETPAEKLKAPINGRDLMELGVRPGPEMGAILDALKDMVIEGTLLPDDRETALMLAKGLML